MSLNLAPCTTSTNAFDTPFILPAAWTPPSTRRRRQRDGAARRRASSLIKRDDDELLEAGDVPRHVRDVKSMSCAYFSSIIVQARRRAAPRGPWRPARALRTDGSLQAVVERRQARRLQRPPRLSGSLEICTAPSSEAVAASHHLWPAPRPARPARRAARKRAAERGAAVRVNAACPLSRSAAGAAGALGAAHARRRAGVVAEAEQSTCVIHDGRWPGDR